MSSGFAFTKLFSSITESTIWCEPNPTRIAWITMLAMADRHGRVWGSVPGLANRARITVEEARAAIDSFLNPDPDSRTPDREGRRIEKIDGGWRLLNHGRYRAIRDEEEKRIRHAQNQAAYRERQKSNARVTGCVTNVIQSDPNAEEEAEAPKNKSIVESSALDLSPISLGRKTDLLDDLVRKGWQYFLEKTRKSPTQYQLTSERLAMGRRGFESLISFAKRRQHPKPTDVVGELFRVAVDRLANSEFHNGKNDSGRTYLDWYQLFKGRDFKPPTKLVEFWLDDTKWEQPDRLSRQHRSAPLGRGNGGVA